MRAGARRLPAVLAAVTALVAVPAAAGAPPSEQPPSPLPPVAGELLVGFRSGVTAGEQEATLRRAGVAARRRLPRIRAVLARTNGAQVGRALAALAADARVRYAEPNHRVRIDALPDDPERGQLWGLDNTGQVIAGIAGKADADIDAPEAWDVTTGSAGVVVGVLDTGVDAAHADLAGAMWTNAGESCAGCRTDGVDNDGNGYVDDWRGWDFFNRDNDPTDDNGHGTHVAGTIGATGDNGTGVVGVSWNVRLMALKFIDANGDGDMATAVEAVLYAAANGARITNNSWGGPDRSQALADAIAIADAADSLFVAAAGNEFSNNDASPRYPSSFDLPNVVSVGATTNTDARAWFSNYGARSVDLAAPGDNILSTWPGGGYQLSSGTSMAAPHVAGAAALVAAAAPAGSAVGTRALLLRTVDANAGFADRATSGGRLNAARAVACSGRPTLWVDTPRSGFVAAVGTPVGISASGATCATPAGTTVTASANGSPVTLTARGDGLWTGSYTPEAPGPLTLALTASANGASDARSVTGSVPFPIVPGGAPVSVTMGVQENVLLSFNGVAGRRVSLKVGNVSIGGSTCCSSRVSVLRPDGTALVTPTSFGTNGVFVDTRTLPADGVYRILVDPQGDAAGGATLTLHDVPPDVSAAIVPGGPSLAVATGPVPGRNAVIDFAGVAGRRISLEVDEVSFGAASSSGAKVSILRPDGTALVSAVQFGTAGTFVDTRTLPVSGTYRIVIDPSGENVGAATLTLYDVPPDVAAAITPGGEAVTVTVGPVPGQNAALRFAGEAGARVSLKLSGVAMASATTSGAKVSILRPDGAALVAATSFGTTGAFLDTRSLPVAGVYTILLDPTGTNVGSATVTLHDVPPDATGTLVRGGTALTVTLGPVPGQNARLTFSGTAGEAVTLTLSGVTIGTSTCCSAKVSVLKPDGTALVAPRYVGRSGATIAMSVPVAGSYAVVLDPVGESTGAATLRLT